MRLETERSDAGDALKDLYTEVKSAGYPIKAMRVMVKRQLETANQRSKREEFEADLEMLEAALGEFKDTPLGGAVIQRAHVTISGE